MIEENEVTQVSEEAENGNAVAPEDSLDSADTGVVEEGLGAGEQEVDDKGVPLKNRVAEALRKQKEQSERLAALEAQNQLLASMLQQRDTKPKEEQALPDLPEDITEAFFESDEYEISPTLSRKILEAAKLISKNTIEREKRQYIDQRKQQQQQQVAIQTEAQKYAEQADKEFSSSEFGKILLRDASGNATGYDMSSPIVKKADQMIRNDPDIRALPVQIREYMAFAKAKLALVGSKSEAKPGDNKAAFAAQGGRGTSGEGVGAGITDKNGKFTRLISDEEYDNLSDDEKDAYDLFSVKANAK